MKYTLADYKTGEGSILRKGRDTYIVLTSSMDMEGWITKLQVLDTYSHAVVEVDPSFVDDLEYVGNNNLLYRLIDNARDLTHEHRLIKNGMGERVKLLKAYRDLEKDQKRVIRELESGAIAPSEYYEKLWLLTDKMVREYLFLED